MNVFTTFGACKTFPCVCWPHKDRYRWHPPSLDIGDHDLSTTMSGPFVSIRYRKIAIGELLDHTNWFQLSFNPQVNVPRASNHVERCGQINHRLCCYVAGQHGTVTIGPSSGIFARSIDSEDGCRVLLIRVVAAIPMLHCMRAKRYRGHTQLRNKLPNSVGPTDFAQSWT